MVLVALATVVAGRGLPLNVLGSLAIGWGVTAAIRLWFGSPLGLASALDVARLLDELKVAANQVRSLDHQIWG